MTDQLMEDLKRIDPLGTDGGEEPSPPTPARIRNADQRTAAALDRAVPCRRARRRTATLAFAGALAAAAAAVALPGGSNEASPSAIAALQSVAQIAAADAAVPRDGVTYQRVIETNVGTIVVGDGPQSAFSIRPRTMKEEWIAPDRSGRVRQVDQGAEFGGPRDERIWRDAGADPNLLDGPGGSSDISFGAGEANELSVEPELPPVTELPADPQELEVIFEAAASDGSVPTNVKVFEYAAAVLMHSAASPELRAALYELVAGIDGVELDGDVRDPLDRTGTGVSIESDYSGALRRSTLIFDPETSQPLAETQELLEPVTWIDSRLLGYTVLEESGQVASVRERP
ncbi:MAG: CU044_5270 family protein [Solirubrobacterales bacterium]